ncbi:MAG: calcium-binding protein [Pseudomonadota bacterium]
MSNSSLSAVELSEGVGLSDPALSFNLREAKHYGTQMPFIDLMKIAQPFGIYTKDGAYQKNDNVEDTAAFDAAGYPTRIPDGASKVVSIWDWGHGDDVASESRKGVFVLEYEGEGEIDLSLHASVISAEPGRIVFENVEGGKFQLDILSTDPEGTGDYIRDITIVREDHEALHDAGAVFNPDWLSLIEDARQLRFMDWARTNHSTNGEWDDRALVEDATWGSSKGVPLEVMVRLSNEIGSDPWFTIPHGATDEYVRAFAEYVKESLDPALVATVEFSNEIWNPAFSQGAKIAEAQVAALGVYSVLEAQAKRATEVALIWDDVFGAEADARVQNVIGTHSANPWTTGELLDAAAWFAAEPDAAVPPATVFDGLAVTTYFGASVARDEEFIEELREAIEDDEVDAFDFLRDQLLTNEDLADSIPAISQRLIGHQNQMAARGVDLDLVVYEGGQHLHQNGGALRDDEELSAFMAEFVRSPQMAELYEASWAAWEAVGDGAYNQFGDVDLPSKYGSWGLYSHLDDTAARTEALVDLNETTAAWWEDRGGVHFQQGVILYGDQTGPSDDALSGSAQEDYLIGGEGADILTGGAGDDGLNGGDGEDIAVFSGDSDAYTIEASGEGRIVSGPDGTDYLIAVETLRFANGDVATETFLAGAAPRPPSSAGGDDQDGALLYVESIYDAEGDSVVVEAINAFSELGRELGIAQGETIYVAYERGATADFADVSNVRANYYSVSENKASKNGPALSDSALETAMALGVVMVSADGVAGSDFKDKLRGRQADDYFDAGAGRDAIVSGAGDDTVVGGEGVDRIKTGSGDDVIVFNEGDGADVIEDFTTRDTLSLVGFDGEKIEEFAALSTKFEDSIVFNFGSGDEITLIGKTLEDIGDLTILM